MRTDFERAYVTADGNVAVLTLNHPEVLNAASIKLLTGVKGAVKFVARPASGFRALVITGAGRGFCSGADLAESPKDGPPELADVLQLHVHPIIQLLRDLEMPVVTAVNGAAAGVGMSLALIGDIVLAARSAYFFQAFARVGLIPDGGATWLLPRLIGLARARELSFLAEKLPAETALQWGLINRVYDDGNLMDEALKLAHRLADGPTTAYAMMRKLYKASPGNGFEEQIHLESVFQGRAGASRDYAEGAAAFFEKRPAKFTGQ